MLTQSTQVSQQLVKDRVYNQLSFSTCNSTELHRVQPSLRTMQGRAHFSYLVMRSISVQSFHSFALNYNQLNVNLALIKIISRSQSQLQWQQSKFSQNNS